jgi:hypothetical protein
MIRARSLCVSSLVALIAGVASGQPIPPAPSNETVVAAEDSVFHVVASRCQRNGVTVDDRTSSGFGVVAGGQLRLVTALHGVAGCKDITLQYNNASFVSQIAKVYLKADLALLDAPDDLHLPGLVIASHQPVPGQVLETIGYGSTLAINPSRTEIRRGGSSTIRSLVKNSKIIAALQQQGFPDVKAPIINIDSPLTPGDSGAPLIDDKGGVVGIANGNLLQGTSPHSWAFPISNVIALLTSTDSVPSSLVLANVLIADEIGTAAAPAPSTNRTSNPSVTCGARTFQYRGAQSYARLLATADQFALTHMNIVQSYAQAHGKTIPPDASFDVYVDSSSGAAFIVPSDYALSVSGSDCVATDSLREIEMRISSEVVPAFQNISALATVFCARTARPGELPLVNVAFTTQPIFRVDSMAIQRYALFYGFPGQTTPPDEGYSTFAWRGGILLEESTRTLVPSFAENANTNFYLSVASVYAASFSLN